MACCVGNISSKNKVFDRLQEVQYPGKLLLSGFLEVPAAQEEAPVSTEQERDFGRIFRESQQESGRHIWVLLRDDAAEDGSRLSSSLSQTPSAGSNQITPLVTKSQVEAGQTGDADVLEDLIEEFLGLLKDHTKEALRSWTDAELRVVIKYVSVDNSFYFLNKQGLAPVYLQPQYLILVAKDCLSVFAYGFVCDPADMRMEGRTPQDKRTPWLLRLEAQLKGDGRLRGGKLRYAVLGDGNRILDKRTIQFVEDDVHELRRRQSPELEE